MNYFIKRFKEGKQAADKTLNSPTPYSSEKISAFCIEETFNLKWGTPYVLGWDHIMLYLPKWYKGAREHNRGLTED